LPVLLGILTLLCAFAALRETKIKAVRFGARRHEDTKKVFFSIKLADFAWDFDFPLRFCDFA
jgi:hypothetical protein